MKRLLLSLLAVPFAIIACSTDSSLDDDDELVESGESGVTVARGFTAQTVVTGLSNPTALAFAPDGRIFVTEQAGKVRLVKNGQLRPTPFLSLTVDGRGERGLLGIALSPTFATDRFVYVHYTATSPVVHNRVSRFTASATGETAPRSSEKVLLDLDPLSSATNHNGGAIHFGKDGKLYVGVGENANGQNAQSFSNLLGKMLRLNPDGTIPSDNPFISQTTGKNEAIWALGLRNPFTFAFEPTTGRLFINDVGQSSFEEIDEGTKGANYGWPSTEGATTNPSFRSPLFTYGHGQSATTGCAISGGAFLNGAYFYADICGGWIRKLDPTTRRSSAFASGIGFPVDLAVSPDGALHYLARTDGAIVKVSPTAATPSAPVITRAPQSLSVAVGQRATFSVQATGNPAPTFQWMRGNANIPGATSATFSITAVTAADDGAIFKVKVTSSAGTVTSSPVTLDVTQPVSSAPTFSQDVWPIIVANCAGCHIGGASGGLSLERTVAHANLVGAPSSCGGASKPRVVAGDPEASLLWQKITNDPRKCGGAMPAGSAGLVTFAPNDVATIEAWIEAGALDD